MVWSLKIEKSSPAIDSRMTPSFLRSEKDLRNPMLSVPPLPDEPEAVDDFQDPHSLAVRLPNLGDDLPARFIEGGKRSLDVECLDGTHAWQKTEHKSPVGEPNAIFTFPDAPPCVTPAMIVWNPVRILPWSWGLPHKLSLAPAQAGTLSSLICQSLEARFGIEPQWILLLGAPC